MKLKNDKIYDYILEEIKNNPKVTESYLSNKYLLSERTIRRYIKDLKDLKKIKLVGKGIKRKWKILY